MPKLARRTALLAKIESTYGTDPTPTGNADAMLVRDLTLTPLAAEVVSRDLIRAFMGASDQLIANRRAEITFDIEAAAAPVAGGVPAYGALLRACNLTQAQTTAAITITRTGSVATATLNAHGLTNGAQVTVSGATQTEYNGTFTISNVTTNTFDYTVTGSPVTPATGSPVLQRSTTYVPNSLVAGSSVTLYCNMDGVNHRITGARGNVEFVLESGQIPVFRFRFVGIYNTVTDTSLPSAVYTGFRTPQVANNAFTSGFQFLGVSGLILQSLSMNLGNTVDFRALIGTEYAQISDRQTSGTAVFEAESVATIDIFGLANAGTTGALALTHGSARGNQILLSATRMDVGQPSYTGDNIRMITAPFVVLPTSGDDDFTLTFQ